MKTNSAETAETLTVTVGSTQFAYRIIGGGSPLVLFQRFRGTMDEWDPAFLNQLAKHNQVIIFDNKGIGFTEGQTPDTMEKIAADARGFIGALSLTKVNALGWSIGGLLAQVFIFKYPELVNKLVLVGTGPAASPETIFPGEKFMNAAKVPDTTPDLYQILFFTEDEAGREETLRSLDRIKTRKGALAPSTRPENWANQLLAARSFFTSPENYFSQLRNIKQPVLVAGAKQDIAFPMLDSYLLAREIPNSQLVVYSNAGHAFQHQHFEHFGNIVNRFLD